MSSACTPILVGMTFPVSELKFGKTSLLNMDIIVYGCQKNHNQLEGFMHTVKKKIVILTKKVCCFSQPV